MGVENGDFDRVMVSRESQRFFLIEARSTRCPPHTGYLEFRFLLAPKDAVIQQSI